MCSLTLAACVARSSTNPVVCRWRQANASSLLGEEVELVEVGNDEFSRVVLSNKMILDHLCTTYERMLQSTRILPSASAADPDVGAEEVAK